MAQLDLVKQKLDNLLCVAAVSRKPHLLSGGLSVAGEGSPNNTAVNEAIAVVEQEATLLRSEVFHINFIIHKNRFNWKKHFRCRLPHSLMAVTRSYALIECYESRHFIIKTLYDKL